MHFTEKSTFWTKICLLIQCVLLLDGVWISFYRNEKKNQCIFLHKSPFFNHKSLQTKSYGKQKRKLYYFAQEKKKGEKIPSSFFKSRLYDPVNAKVWMAKKKVEKICHLALDIMPKSLHNILRVTLVSTGLVRLLLLAKHLSLLSVWSLLRRLIVRSFFTTPSNVCWYVSSSNLSSMYQITLGRGSPETIRK